MMLKVSNNKVYVGDDGIELMDVNRKINADDEIALQFKNLSENMTLSKMVAEAILTLKPDFGGYETSDLESGNSHPLISLGILKR